MVEEMLQKRCAVARECGGCSQVDVQYAGQLAAKDARVCELFAEFPDAEVRPILGMDEPYHYRNKVISPYAPGKKGQTDARGARAKRGIGDRRDAGDKRGAGGWPDAGDNRGMGEGRGAGKGHGKRGRKDIASGREILTGMYAAGTHRLVPTESCLVENEQAQQVVRAVRSIMMRHGIEPYDENRGVGFLRHAVVRVGHESGEVLVTLVTNEDEFPASKSFCRELVRRCPFVTSVVQNVNTRQTNVILGEKERRLYGPGFILDTLCGLSFRISSRSFYQVNAVQTTVLYEQAMSLAGLGAGEARGGECGEGSLRADSAGRSTASPSAPASLPGMREPRGHGAAAAPVVVDAYCGTGTIGLVAAKRGAARVIGVDSVESAIRDARENARHNGVENARFVTADASAFMRELAQVGDRVDVVFMDPPRAGSTPEFLDSLAQLAPARVVYVSCNPQTQVRDLRFLVEHGYGLRVVQPVDMFPHTDHIETVCLVEKAS